MMEKKKIVFIVDSLSQPRCIKRVTSFMEAGYRCEVYGYERNKYNCNTYPSDIKVTILGTQRDGTDYYEKYRCLKKDIRRIIKKNKASSPIYYSFGFLSSLFFFLFGKHYVYEISDILYGYPRFSKVLWLFKWIDKKMIKKSLVTVMTSKGFYDFYGIKDSKIVIQPNKVNSSLRDYHREPMCCEENKGLVFSFVGAVRYDSILRFANVIGHYFPEHKFYFYGQASGKTLEKCLELSNKNSNVAYFGAFKNPDDLVDIYRNINIVVACYTPTALNEKLAEPNKLYEALFFCKPIIVSEGIFLTEQVRRYDCGFSLDATREQTIIEFIKGISVEKINEISMRESHLLSKELTDNPNELLEIVRFNCNS